MILFTPALPGQSGISRVTGRREVSAKVRLVMARNTRQFKPADLRRCALLIALGLLPLQMVQAQTDEALILCRCLI